MIRASQKAVVHEANVGLVNIRNIEVQYFGRFFSNFGTQAAFMIGFILSAISQVPGNYNPSGSPEIFLVFFWVGSAGTLCFSIHVLVCTMFITVFGEGLALRGPLGSMVKAVKGMIHEQKQVLVAFCCAIFFFTFQAVGMYWIMMDMYGAIICTIMTFGAVPFWYTYSLHIYNRFNWGEIDIEKWDDSRREALDSSYAYARDVHRYPLDETANAHHTAVDKTAKAIIRRRRGRGGVEGGQKEEEQGGGGDDMSSQRSGFSPRDDPGEEDPVELLKRQQQPQLLVGTQQGYLTLRERRTNLLVGAGNVLPMQPSSSSSNSTSNHDPLGVTGILRSSDPSSSSSSSSSRNDISDVHTLGDGNNASASVRAYVWERRYFVLQNHMLYYYKDQYAFEEDPYKPINHRPIDLEGYTLIAGTIEPPYAISLIPIDPDDIRKAWKFRCDTISEFQHWVEVLSGSVPSEFTNSTSSQQEAGADSDSDDDE